MFVCFPLSIQLFQILFLFLIENKKSKKLLLDSKNGNESDGNEDRNNSQNVTTNENNELCTIRNSNENNNNNNNSNMIDISLTNGYNKAIISPKLNNFTTLSSQQQQQRSPLLNNSNSIQPTPTTTATPSSTVIDADGYEIPNGNPIEWNCDQVYSFVKTIAGPSVAHTFKIQEVDGSALMLIKDDHLVNTMQIKLGPALKILYKFNEIRARF